MFTLKNVHFEKYNILLLKKRLFLNKNLEYFIEFENFIFIKNKLQLYSKNHI